MTREFINKNEVMSYEDMNYEDMVDEDINIDDHDLEQLQDELATDKKSSTKQSQMGLNSRSDVFQSSEFGSSIASTKLRRYQKGIKKMDTNLGFPEDEETKDHTTLNIESKQIRRATQHARGMHNPGSKLGFSKKLVHFHTFCDLERMETKMYK